MYLFGKKNTIMVIGGIVFLHVLDGMLCGFFVYKFMMITFDPGVFVLLFVLLGPLVICDTMAKNTQAFSRFLVRCTMDSEGIYCTSIAKKWRIRWDDICIFGVTGFSSTLKKGIAFLSSDSDEKYQKKTLTHISQKRLAFSVEDGIWENFRAYMPEDIRKKLEKSINNTYDCFYRRKIKQ